MAPESKLRSFRSRIHAQAPRRCGVLFVWVLLLSSGAYAQAPRDKAAAEALFLEGRELVTGGKLDLACEKFAASQKLDPAIGTLLNLGDCYERIRRSASAWANFREAADLARVAGDSAREEEGRRRAAALEIGLSRLRILAPAPPIPQGLVVWRDGLIVDSGIFGSPVPVDPGEHRIEASAPGRESWHTVVVMSAPAQTLDVTIPVLVSRRKEPRAEPTPSLRSEEDTRWGAQRYGAAAAAGVGLAGIGVGALFGLRAQSRWDDAKTLCPGNACPDPRDVTLEDQARRDASIATASMGIGLAAIATGVVLWITAPATNKPTQQKRVSMGVWAWSHGMMIGGRYE